jgi:hypothetical protein
MRVMNISTIGPCTRRTVKYTIDKRHVNSQNLHDRFCCKELEGPGECYAEDVLPPIKLGVSLLRKANRDIRVKPTIGPLLIRTRSSLSWVSPFPNQETFGFSLPSDQEDRVRMLRRKVHVQFPTM